MVAFIKKVQGPKYNNIENIKDNDDVQNLLLFECERAKIQLSTTFEATVRIEERKMNDGNEVASIEVTITRDEFEDGAHGIFENIIKPVEDALELAVMAKDEIDHVILMGGSTRIPWVKNWLMEYFGKNENELRTEVNVDEGVAIGATIMAANLAGQIDSLVVVSDVLPMSIGIEKIGNRVTELIKRGSTIPCEGQTTFKTTKDN